MREEFGNRYKVTEKVGSGGMAEVYKAYDPVLNRVVAIKTLHPQFAQEEDFIARFRREAQSAANLNHSNIVNVYDWGREGNTYFIVMEYLEGKNLKQLIEEKGALDASEAVGIASKVLQALEVAHQNEVIHRDIKPGNIIINPQGEVKVTDFGIARAGATSTMTQTGSIVGTAQYISPEQAQGATAEAPSDLYSLGVVLYEMLTGSPPFEGDSPVAVALKQVNEEPVPPRKLRPDIPKPLETVVMHALSKNPSDRYQDAAEFREDLAKVAQGLPVKKGGFSPGDKTVVMKRPLAKKRRGKKTLLWTALIILAILLAVAGGLAIGGLFAPKTAVVPDLKGKAVTEAKLLLKTKGLELKVEERKYSSKVKTDRIISQDPKAGDKIDKGGVVFVVVSKGRQGVKVPDVTGEDLGQATHLLGEVGLEIGQVQKVYSDEVEEDTVISQDPKAGKKVAKETAVNLVVSKGSQRVSIPDVVGKTSSQAAAILGQASLNVEQQEESSKTVGEGKVIRTIPAAGAEVKRGATVAIIVSTGPEHVVVPDVTTKLQATATTQLETAGFSVDAKTQSGVPPAQVGRVITQNPTGGEQADDGSTVTIWIGTP